MTRSCCAFGDDVVVELVVGGCVPAFALGSFVVGAADWGAVGEFVWLGFGQGAWGEDLVAEGACGSGVDVGEAFVVVAARPVGCDPAVCARGALDVDGLGHAGADDRFADGQVDDEPVED